MKKQPKNLAQRVWDNIKPAFLAKNSYRNPNNVPLFNRTGSVTENALGFDILMGNEDYYKGYLFSAIRNRANAVAQLAADHLVTEWSDEKVELPHPYLSIIDESPTFSNNFFWKTLSTFLDLKGVAYLMAIRAFNNNRFGDIKEFKIINPYDVTRVVNTTTGEVGGFYETRYGMNRTIPPEMMIVIQTLNPFDLDLGYALATAAAEEQYLNQQASTYTRNSIRNNVGQRGALSTDVLLDEEDFRNFKNAVEANAGSNAGKFIYGNGAGALNYIDMQIDLDKLALDKINEISREKLFAVAGVSKTILGMEMSGVTRETGRVQSDLFTQQQTMPQVQLIIDALNQDFKNHYKDDYAKQKPVIIIDSPLKVDRDAELKDAEVMKTKAETAKILLDAGFAVESTLETVGLPEIEFEGKPDILDEPANPGNQQEEPVTQHVHIDHDDPLLKLNQLTPGLKEVILSKQSSLENEIQNIQSRLVQASLKKFNKITEAQEDEVITKKDKNASVKELAAALALFYLEVIPLFASQTTKERLKQFGLATLFTMNRQIKGRITEHAKQVAISHVETVLSEVYKVAQDAAAKGLGREQTVANILKSFNDTISRVQATRIARTETNRSMAEAQYEADRQFIEQNGLEGKVFKRWITRSANPCKFCLELEAKTKSNPIPFSGNFVDLGGTVEAEFETKDGTTTRTYVAGYEPIGSGTLHANCSCIYELIIKD